MHGLRSALVRWQPVISRRNADLSLVAHSLRSPTTFRFGGPYYSSRDWSNAPTWGYGAVLTLLLLTAVHYACWRRISTRTSLKPVLCASLLIGAVVAHYISRYGIVIDTSMMRNVLQTDAHEAVELVDIDFAGDAAHRRHHSDRLFVLLTNCGCARTTRAGIPGGHDRCRSDRGDVSRFERISRTVAPRCAIATKFGNMLTPA